MQPRLPNLRALPAEIAPNVLVVGDPHRAEVAAQLLEGAQEVGNFREYRTFSGSYAGERVTIASHGVGSAGASICFQELFTCGVRHAIRAGTCGGMQATIRDGELIIAAAAVREDGTSPSMLPIQYPAFADRAVIAALESAAQRQRAAAHTGVILTRPSLYSGLLPDGFELWMRAGILGVEMELAILLILASMNGVRAGGIFVSDGNIALARQSGKELDIFDYNPHREVIGLSVRTMLQIALDALVQLGKAD
jgi:uridine phosphorylase